MKTTFPPKMPTTFRVRTRPEKANFTVKQMQAAFDMVKDDKDWKKPIRKTFINPGEKNIACVIAAIPYFTGTTATLTMLHHNTIRITAEGAYSLEPKDESGGSQWVLAKRPVGRDQ